MTDDRQAAARIYKSTEGARLVAERYREFLDRWPVPRTELRVATREGETFVVASGPQDAPPVLLLQGSGANSAMWGSAVARWSTALRVYAVDVVGEPGGSAPSRPQLRGDAHARWLDDVRQGLGLTRTSLVGVSLGGWMALDYATRRPEHVDRLVLLSPSGIGRQRLGILAKAILLRPFGAWGRRRLFAAAVGPAPDGAGSPELLRIGEFALLIAAHFRPRMEAVPVLDDSTLGRLEMPVLVVVGERDAMLDSHGTRARLAAAVPHATVCVLPGVGHVVGDQSARVLAFLQDG